MFFCNLSLARWHDNCIKQTTSEAGNYHSLISKVLDHTSLNSLSLDDPLNKAL